ncbi:MAG: hypothetical protein ABI683_04685, partial [Ginsengibacter sp.]
TVIREKMFVRTDKNFYIAGEILWFKIYNVNAATNVPLALSKVAYVELLDSANKRMVQAKIALDNAEGNGSFYLPINLNTGNYKFRAYTNWMKNFGAGYFFETKISVVNVQKIINALKVANDAKYDIDFFPEGGNLVGNIPAKVAFKEIDQYGRGIDLKGYLLDNNDTVLSFMPLHAGIGTFSFTPLEGHIYKAMMTTDAGESFSKTLPAAYKNGYVMNLADAGNEIEVTVRSDIQAGREVYLFVQANGIMQIEKQQTLRNGQASFTIDKKDLGDGISYFTIFNDERKPVTERLYFKKPSQSLAINVTSDQPMYDTRKKIILNVAIPDAGAAIDTASLSISVYKLDSLQSKDVPDITEYLLLNSALAGYVEDPGYYFTNNNAETKTALDNIMLTHGWRRFKWEDFLNNKKAYFEYVPEFNGPIFMAKVINTITGKPAPGIDTYLSVQGLDAAFTSSISDVNGLVKFELKKVYGPSEIILQTNTMRDSVYRIDVADPYSSNFSGTSYPFLYVDPATENPLKTESVSMQVQNIYAGKKLKEFASPNIDTTVFYANADGKYLLDNYTRFTTIEEVLREYVAMADVRKREGSFHYELYNNASGLMLKNDPLVMLDGIAVFDFNKFMEVDPLKLYKLEVMNRRYFLGNSIFNGILNWTSYKDDLAGYEPGPHATIIDYDGLQAEREFYSPSYTTENARASHIPDFRNVLQWTPTLKLAPGANKMIEFYSSDLPGKYVIDVQGISKNGIPGSKTSTFEIKR